jgi:hypothetical protein
MFFDDNHLRTVADNLSSTKPEKVINRKRKILFNKNLFQDSSSSIK